MNSLLKIFKYLAYFNLPLALAAIYLVYEPIFTKDSEAFDKNLPTALILVGFAMSISSLRDIKKTDKMSRYIIERPKVFKVFILITMLLAVGTSIWGGVMMFSPDEYSLGIGFTSFGVGYLALIKSIIDQAKDLTDHYQ